MEATIKYAIVDYHYLLKEFANCKKYKLVIPNSHVQTLRKALSTEKKLDSQQKIRQILDYIQSNAIILSNSTLPQLGIHTNGIKFSACTFARYVLLAQSIYPNIKVISDSRETKFLLKKLGLPVSNAH